MPTLSASQKQSLVDATSRYHQSLPGSLAAELLEARGIADQGNRYSLGYVADPLPGHERYRGMLAIPYLRRGHSGWSVASLRFRCARSECSHDGHPKYTSIPGDQPRLYNTVALLTDSPVVAVCEGEIDAISATASGLPAVGVAGVELWKPHFAEPFRGYETVYALADGDDPGMRFAEKLKKQLSNVTIVASAPGEDVNSEMVRHGRDYIRGKASA